MIDLNVPTTAVRGLSGLITGKRFSEIRFPSFQPCENTAARWISLPWDENAKNEELSDRFFSTDWSLRTRTQRDKRVETVKDFCLVFEESHSLSPVSLSVFHRRVPRPRAHIPFTLFFFSFSFCSDKSFACREQVTERRRAGYFCRFNEKNRE